MAGKGTSAMFGCSSIMVQRCTEHSDAVFIRSGDGDAMRARQKFKIVAGGLGSVDPEVCDWMKIGEGHREVRLEVLTVSMSWKTTFRGRMDAV
jgi:hypothetical protein